MFSAFSWKRHTTLNLFSAFCGKGSRWWTCSAFFCWKGPRRWIHSALFVEKALSDELIQRYFCVEVFRWWTNSSCFMRRGPCDELIQRCFSPAHRDLVPEPGSFTHNPLIPWKSMNCRPVFHAYLRIPTKKRESTRGLFTRSLFFPGKSMKLLYQLSCVTRESSKIAWIMALTIHVLLLNEAKSRESPFLLFTRDYENQGKNVKPVSVCMLNCLLREASL